MGIIRLIFVTIVVLFSFKSNSNSVRAADDSLQCIHEYTRKCCDLSSLIYVLSWRLAGAGAKETGGRSQAPHKGAAAHRRGLK